MMLLLLILMALSVAGLYYCVKILKGLRDLRVELRKLDKEKLELEKFVTKKLDTVYTPKPSVTIVDADDPATIVKMEALERERKQHRGPKPDER